MPPTRPHNGRMERGAGAAARELRGIADTCASWSDFAEQAFPVLRKVIPFDAGIFAPFDPISGLISGSVKTSIPDSAYPRFAYFEYVDPDMTTFAEIAQREMPLSVLSRETSGDLRRSARFREFFEPELSIGGELRYVLREGGRVWGGMSLFRAAGAPEFSDDHLDALLALTPVLLHGLRSRSLEGSGSSPEPAQLLLDDTGALCAADSQAPAWLQLLDPGRKRPLPVPVVSAVTATAASPVGIGSIIALTALGPVSVRASRLHGNPSGYTAVTISAPTSAERTRIALAAFALTARESEVAGLVLAGHSTRSIAAALNLSPYTVQDHLKRVFEKSGLRSRREFVAAVGSPSGT
jgi:DNA-binding CsgD family transcriptional regulator